MVALPLQTGAADEETADDATDGAGRALSILVAEDNAINQKLIRLLLESAGHAVTIVPNGAEAVTAVAASCPDVVLMDRNMPVMDGIAAARAIRALPAPAGQVPIIALTASADGRSIATCREAGMNDHVAKPIEAAALFAAIARAVAASDSKADRAAA